MKKALTMMLVGSVLTLGAVYYMGHETEVNRVIKKIVKEQESMMTQMKEKMGM